MSLKSSQLESLERRLAETREREKELARQMKKAQKAYAQAAQFVPPPPRKPAIREATEPRRRGAGIAHGDRKEYREVMQFGAPEAEEPRPARREKRAGGRPAPAEEAAAELLESRVPDYPSIRKTPTFLTASQTGHGSGARSLPRAPYGTIGSVYGIESTIGDLRRSREKRHPAFRAFFAIGMAVLLSIILIRILI